MKTPTITRESWDLIAENIEYIVSNADSYDDMSKQLEEYLAGEGIVEVEDEVETNET